MSVTVSPILSGSYAEDADSHVLVFPATELREDDILWVFIFTDDGAMTAPTGWTQIAGIWSPGTSQWFGYSFYHFVDADDISSGHTVTFNPPGASDDFFVCQPARIRGATPPLPVAAHGPTTNAADRALATNGTSPRDCDLAIHDYGPSANMARAIFYVGMNESPQGRSGYKWTSTRGQSIGSTFQDNAAYGSDNYAEVFSQILGVNAEKEQAATLRFSWTGGGNDQPFAARVVIPVTPAESPSDVLGVDEFKLIRASVRDLPYMLDTGMLDDEGGAGTWKVA